ncbi:hypothetical protein CDAR_196141 [Caerostris darwini]|uniref:Uncharacterized protein n=1 Tax=Caerostris darwini TaxID=1538125 RepID=A0AAV4MH16_9ARAC|nr:hypothetical protein CDAR_196141 [Caerostris darwini]
MEAAPIGLWVTSRIDTSTNYLCMSLGNSQVGHCQVALHQKEVGHSSLSFELGSSSRTSSILLGPGDLSPEPFVPRSQNHHFRSQPSKCVSFPPQ